MVKNPNHFLLREERKEKREERKEYRNNNNEPQVKSAAVSLIGR